MNIHLPSYFEARAGIWASSPVRWFPPLSLFQSDRTIQSADIPDIL